MKNKGVEFYPNVTCSTYNIICLSETWLDSGAHSSEYFPDKFIVFRSDRNLVETGRLRGGGVLIALSRDLNVSIVDLSSLNIPPLIDIIGCKLLFSHYLVYIFAVYIPPNIVVNELQQFFEKFGNYLNNLENVAIIGDFNVSNFHGSIRDNKSDLVYNFLSFTGLKQSSTILNSNGRLLDLVIQSNNVNCIVEENFHPLLNIDVYHPALCIDVNLVTNTVKKLSSSTKSKAYNFRKANFIDLYMEMGSINWEFLYKYEEINQLVDEFYQCLYTTLDKFVPRCGNKKTSYPHWFSTTLKQKMSNKTYFHIKYKKYRTHFYYTEFTKLRKECKQLAHSDYRTYINKIQNELKTNPSQFWQYVRSKSGHSGVPGVMNYSNKQLTSPTSIVNSFKEYFSSVFVSDSVSNSETHFSGIRPSSDIVHIAEINEVDLIRATKKLKGNLCSGLDNVPALFVKDCAYTLATPLLFIYNKCLKTTTFPDIWKQSRICPVLKSGNSSDITNYRPISILSNFAKLFESIIYSYIFPQINNTISLDQHGFMPNKSTATNLASITQYIAVNLDCGKQVDVVYMDMTKAFDRIIHTTLLRKLNYMGFSTSLIKFVHSYLSNRKMTVVCNGYTSDSYVQTSGVPQGSNLGPLLFLLYINDIGCSIQNCKSLLYADDLKIFRTVNNIDECKLIQSDLLRLDEWCKNNGLQFNISKCKVIKYSKCRNNLYFQYNINNTIISYTEYVKDLGVTFESNLCFKTHINNIVQSAYKVLGFIIRNTQLFDDSSTLRILFFSLVRSKLEYCSVVWSPFYAYLVRQIEDVQRRFLKYLYFKKFGHYPVRGVNQVVLNREFNFESLVVRRVISDICFLYNILHNKIKCPELLQNIPIHVPAANLRSKVTFENQFFRTNLGKVSPINRLCKNFNIYANNCDIFFDNIDLILNTIKEHMCMSQ